MTLGELGATFSDDLCIVEASQSERLAKSSQVSFCYSEVPTSLQNRFLTKHVASSQIES